MKYLALLAAAEAQIRALQAPLGRARAEQARPSIEVHAGRDELTQTTEPVRACGAGLTTMTGIAGEGATHTSSKRLAVFRQRDGAWQNRGCLPRAFGGGNALRPRRRRLRAITKASFIKNALSYI